MLKTVRVAHPSSGGFMIINASDYRPLVHGDLWHEQAPDFDGVLPPPTPIGQYSAAEKEAAANLMFDAIEFDMERSGKPAFATLSPGDRMVFLRDQREDLQRARAGYAERYSRQRAERTPVQVPDGVIPGETPGWPIDNETGDPLDLSDEERARLVAANLDKDAPAPVATDVAQPAVPPAQAPGPDGAAPSWLKPAGQAATPASTVEKGPGGKWYVMRDGKPASEGFRTKAEADALAAKSAE